MRSSPGSRTLDTSTSKTVLFLGCDTETYRDERGRGLKSIQVYGDATAYFTATDWDDSDDDIRFGICRDFFAFLFSLNNNVNIAFFNINFDASQFLKYMVSELGLELWREPYNVPRGCMQILESERKLYMIQIRTKKGFLIRMIDLANFLVGVTLNKACKDWLGEQKIDLPSKQFLKQPATPIEIEYAMKDAELTYKLFLKLIDEQVIEGFKAVTIGGRTLKHFKKFIVDDFGMKFAEYFYKGASKEEIIEIQRVFEEEARPGVRGGICQAWHKGIFKDCLHVDARSMYPTQCVRDYIPIGPLLSEPPDSKYTSIVYPVGYYTLKEGKVPNIQWRSKAHCNRYRYMTKYEPGDFVRDFYLDGSYPIWQEEYEIVKECYDIKGESIEKVWYIEMAENTVLKPYVEMLYKGKQTNTGSKKQYYKALLNSLYGKLLSRPDGIGIDYVCVNGEWRRIKVETTKQVYYLPLGSWIAMMGRVTLMKAILSIPSEDFLYCDTDSIIMRKNGHFPDIKIGEWLGEWGIEQDNVDVNVVGPKTYQELKQDGTVITKCGGLPTEDKAKVKWTELQEGLVVHTAKPRRDVDTWAINFEDVDFTINTRANAFLSR